MIKKYGLVLDTIQTNKFKRLVPAKIRRKALETFIFDKYQPTSVLIDNPPKEVEKKRGRGRPKNETAISTNMAFSDDAIAFIDELVDKLKKEGVTGTNRSSVIRNIISEFNKMYEDESNVFTSPSDLKPNTFHVEKETHGFLTKWTKTRSLNYSIEQLILDPDFPKLTEDDISYLNFTPSNLVPIRISISAKAYAVFDDIIKNLGLGITRAAIMRLAVRKLIEIDKGIPLTELIAKKNLGSAIYNYENIAGPESAHELISDYLNKSYDKEE